MAEPKASTSNIIRTIKPSTSKINLGLLNSGSSSRLESFRTPRDLSLSKPPILPIVNKSTKRKFEPIIPTTKIKPKVEAASSSRDDTKKRKKEHKLRKDGNFRDRVHNRRENMYIQTHGSVFDDMFVKPTHRLKPRYESKIFTSSSKKTEAGPKPYFKVEELEIPEEDDHEEIIKQMKDYNVDEPKAKPRPGDAKPIKLPFKKQANAKQEMKKEIKDEPAFSSFVVHGVRIKQEVKEEPGDGCESKPTLSGAPEMRGAEVIDLTDLSISEILTQAPGSIFLLQMPDNLPGHVEADVEPKPSTSGQETSTTPSRKSVPCTLKDLGEGLLGHVEIMASGRVRLNLGNGRVMYMDAGTSTSVRQEVVSIDLEAENKTGTMKVLGDVQGHAIVSPDWETELEHITKRKT